MGFVGSVKFTVLCTAEGFFVQLSPSALKVPLWTGFGPKLKKRWWVWTPFAKWTYVSFLLMAPRDNGDGHINNKKECFTVQKRTDVCLLRWFKVKCRAVKQAKPKPWTLLVIPHLCQNCWKAYTRVIIILWTSKSLFIGGFQSMLQTFIKLCSSSPNR